MTAQSSVIRPLVASLIKQFAHTSFGLQQPFWLDSVQTGVVASQLVSQALKPKPVSAAQHVESKPLVRSVQFACKLRGE